MAIHELIDGLPDGFLAPPVKTVGRILMWYEYRHFYSDQSWEKYPKLDGREWLLHKMAFGNEGVRMIQR